MILHASIHTRVIKVRSFFDDNMGSAIPDMDIIEAKWQSVLRDGTLPGQAHTALDVIRRTMKADVGFVIGIDNKLKVMDTMT